MYLLPNSLPYPTGARRGWRKWERGSVVLGCQLRLNHNNKITHFPSFKLFKIFFHNSAENLAHSSERTGNQFPVWFLLASIFIRKQILLDQTICLSTTIAFNFKQIEQLSKTFSSSKFNENWWLKREPKLVHWHRDIVKTQLKWLTSILRDTNQLVNQH